MTREKLLQDPSFVNWATGQNEQDIIQWDIYFREHPEHVSVLLRTRGELLSKKTKQNQIDLNKAWSPIELEIAKSNRRGKNRKILAWSSIAAAVVLGILTVVHFTVETEISRTLTEIETTNSGEINTIALPDGSMVTLNGNSAIRYSVNLAKDKVRTVEVEGEVFFEVTHNNTPFVVNLGDAEVTVLGTRFNVNSRAGRRCVSLLEGSVDIYSSTGNKVILRPGQSAYIDTEIKVVEGDVEAVSSWKERIWTFKNTPVATLIEKLWDDFGVRVSVENPAIRERLISGKLSTMNLEVLYQALETLLDVRIERGYESIILVQK